VKGTLGEGSLAGDPEGYVERVLETGISFHRGPVWETWRRAHLPGTSIVYEGALGKGSLSLSLRGCVVGGGLGGAPSQGTLEDRFFERYARCPLGGPPSHRGPVGEPGGDFRLPGLLREKKGYLDSFFGPRGH
jgi:hypothetical protein